jgi:hypothetical protein
LIIAMIDSATFTPWARAGLNIVVDLRGCSCVVRVWIPCLKEILPNAMAPLAEFGLSLLCVPDNCGVVIPGGYYLATSCRLGHNGA